jgi:hypothetical protein
VGILFGVCPNLREGEQLRADNGIDKHTNLSVFFFSRTVVDSYTALIVKQDDGYVNEKKRRRHDGGTTSNRSWSTK